MLGCTEKKYVPINSIQRCLGIYYLFYDIFVMNVIHRTINNNKTGRVFVFFQKGHAIFQLVFGDFIILFFFALVAFVSIYINLRIRYKKYQLTLNSGYMQSQSYIYFIKSANITAYQAV